jgi:hypothetical protein
MTLLARTYRKCLPLLLLLGPCHSALAHPMGNFSVNHYSKVTLESNGIRVRYFIDLAEIPTFQEMQQASIPTTAIDPDSAAVINYVAARGVELGTGPHPQCEWQTGFPSPHFQRSDLSSRRGWPTHYEDGLCLRSSLPIDLIER